MDIDVLIPARRDSLGLPGKNMRVLIDRPLVLHSVACAQQLNRVRHILVSTDDPLLAETVRSVGAFVPSLRPDKLATSATPMADVIRHAMMLLDDASGTETRLLLLLDPTSPLRDPQQINEVIEEVLQVDDLDGAVSISTPAFNPLWVGVELGIDGRIQRHSCTPTIVNRRQDAPAYWRINGSFYIWQNDFARTIGSDWLDQGNFKGVETPEIFSHSIDTIEDFRMVEVLLSSGMVSFPWMEKI